MVLFLSLLKGFSLPIQSLAIDLLKFSIYYLVSFGSLCVSINLSISSGLTQVFADWLLLDYFLNILPGDFSRLGQPSCLH